MMSYALRAFVPDSQPLPLTDNYDVGSHLGRPAVTQARIQQREVYAVFGRNLSLSNTYIVRVRTGTHVSDEGWVGVMCVNVSESE